MDINSYNVYDYNTIGKNASHQKKNVDKNQLQKMLQFLQVNPFSKNLPAFSNYFN